MKKSYNTGVLERPKLTKYVDLPFEVGGCSEAPRCGYVGDAFPLVKTDVRNLHGINIRRWAGSGTELVIIIENYGVYVRSYTEF